MPRALVINPWVCDFKLYDEWMHPLGLYLLISLLRHNGWDTRYINCLERTPGSPARRFGTGTFRSEVITKPSLYRNIPRNYKRYGISEDEFGTRLTAGTRPDIIFAGSGMTYWIPGLEKTLSVIRGTLPGVPIIVGGISATLAGESITSRIPGIITHKGRLAGSTAPLSGIHPLLKSLSAEKWNGSMTGALELIDRPLHGPLFTSAGCPLKCDYCASRILQPLFYFRKKEIIVEETTWFIKNAGVRDFAVYDDAMLYHAEKNLFPVLDGLYREKIRIHTPNGLHARKLSRGMLERLCDAGLTTLRLGYETGARRYNSAISFKTNRADMSKRIKLAHACGLDKNSIGVYIMSGLPGQNVREVLSDIRFIASSGALAKPVFLSPVPGTPLFDYYAKTFPQIIKDPLWHNDTFFVTMLDGWGYAAIEEIKGLTREKNREYNVGAVHEPPLHSNRPYNRTRARKSSRPGAI